MFHIIKKDLYIFFSFLLIPISLFTYFFLTGRDFSEGILFLAGGFLCVTLISNIMNVESNENKYNGYKILEI